MRRNEFLKGVGLFGFMSAVPFKNVLANVTKGNKTTACVLIPGETEGPFPLDLTTNSYYFRQDVREDRAGVELIQKIKVIGLDNCQPMPNVRVNIWHCDKDGVYSGYATAQNPGGDANAKWLRGYQMTDANGEVEFTTIFPGWYPGRVAHIHFQVFVSSVYKAVSQLTWDHATKTALYNANLSIYTDGPDPKSPGTDGVFADGFTNQVASLADNGDGTYSSYLELAINGAGSPVGLMNYEGETGGHFKLGQNFPNPHQGFTSIPFTVVNSSEVQIDIFDLQARKVATINKGQLTPGNYNAEVNFAALGIPSGSYIYQLQAVNSKGTFRFSKMMTAVK